MQPQSASGPKFRVAICGAGIGGLILAITIGKYDPSIPIDLYEAHASVETSGVGITVWKKTHEVLIDLGLFGDFKQIFTQNPQSLRVRRSDIREGGRPWFELAPRHGRSAMHRQHMVAVLERRLPASCTVHSGKRLINYVEQDAHLAQAIRLEFADGTTATTDVLVGADGIRSAVRKAMFEAASKDSGNKKKDFRQYIDASFTGILAYRALVPAETLRKENPENIALQQMTAYSGKGRLFGTYPIARGNLINIVAYMFDPSLTGTHYEGHWVSDAAIGELAACFDDFEPDVRTVAKLCEKSSKWALHTTKPLPFCARNRVALVGDACHAMTPHFGAGAVEAIDDAFILGRLIAHPLTSLSRIQEAFRIYDEIRLPIARSVADISLSTGWMYAFMAPDYYDGTRERVDHGIDLYEKDGMEAIKQEILRRWDILDGMRDAVQIWKDAEMELQALACQTGLFPTLREALVYLANLIGSFRDKIW